jgi:protocatechuate 3,4-dioxygenase beta subunit
LIHSAGVYCGGFEAATVQGPDTVSIRERIAEERGNQDVVQLLALIVLAQDRPSPEWMPLLDAPRSLSHVLTIPPPANPGPRMELRGKVLKSDGRTPAPGVIVYFHHTDGRGIYPRPAGSSPADWIYWHGSARGWLKSDAQGNYVLKTTRPAPYPGRRDPAHIHAYGLPPGSRRGVTFRGIVFYGDPFLTERDEGIVRLTADKNGVMQGRFDLVIPR